VCECGGSVIQKKNVLNATNFHKSTLFEWENRDQKISPFFATRKISGGRTLQKALGKRPLSTCLMAACTSSFSEDTPGDQRGGCWGCWGFVGTPGRRSTEMGRGGRKMEERRGCECGVRWRANAMETATMYDANGIGVKAGGPILRRDPFANKEANPSEHRPIGDSLGMTPSQRF